MKNNEVFGSTHVVRDAYKVFNIGCNEHLGPNQSICDSPRFEKGLFPTHALLSNTPKHSLEEFILETEQKQGSRVQPSHEDDTEGNVVGIIVVKKEATVTWEVAKLIGIEANNGGEND